MLNLGHLRHYFGLFHNDCRRYFSSNVVTWYPRIKEVIMLAALGYIAAIFSAIVSFIKFGLTFTSKPPTPPECKK